MLIRYEDPLREPNKSSLLYYFKTRNCGSWGGNSIDENLNWSHFVNRVNVVRVIPEKKPELEDIFASYWDEFGK